MMRNSIFLLCSLTTLCGADTLDHTGSREVACAYNLIYAHDPYMDADQRKILNALKRDITALREEHAVAVQKIQAENEQEKRRIVEAKKDATSRAYAYGTSIIRKINAFLEGKSKMHRYHKVIRVGNYIDEINDILFEERYRYALRLSPRSAATMPTRIVKKSR